VSTNVGSSSAMMTKSKSIDRGDRVPADVIEQDVWQGNRLKRDAIPKDQNV
jgi:hypothetical protein